MTTLAEIEHAVAALPREQKVALFHALQLQLREPSPAHSVLDIPSVSLGGILKPLDDDEQDLLGEMLDDSE